MSDGYHLATGLVLKRCGINNWSQSQVGSHRVQWDLKTHKVLFKIEAFLCTQFFRYNEMKVTSPYI